MILIVRRRMYHGWKELARRMQAGWEGRTGGASRAGEEIKLRDREGKVLYG